MAVDANLYIYVRDLLYYSIYHNYLIFVIADKICINPDESCLAMGLDADAFRLNTESCDYPRVQLREGGTVGSKTLVEKYIRHKGKWYKYDSYYVRVTEIVQNVRRHNSRRRSGSVVGAVPNTNVEYVYNRGGDECMTRVYIGCAAGTFVGAFITGLVIVVTHM